MRHGRLALSLSCLAPPIRRSAVIPPRMVSHAARSTLHSTLTLSPAAGKLWERKAAALVLKGTYAAKLKELGVSMGIEPHHLVPGAHYLEVAIVQVQPRRFCRAFRPQRFCRAFEPRKQTHSCRCG